MFKVCIIEENAAVKFILAKEVLANAADKENYITNVTEPNGSMVSYYGEIEYAGEFCIKITLRKLPENKVEDKEDSTKKVTKKKSKRSKK